MVGHRLLLVHGDSISLLWHANTTNYISLRMRIARQGTWLVFRGTNRTNAPFSSKEEPNKMTSSIKLYFHTAKIRFLPLLLTKCSYSKKIEAGKLISIIHLVNVWYIRLGWRGYRTQHSFLPFACAIHLNPFGHSLYFFYIHIIANIITLVVTWYALTFCHVLNL